ncbi:MAG: hypothetical protein L0346_15240, partial [Chloroflexi bacterium]|nr:hypothetical protein [Chloroflexota bacterium]
MDRKITLIGGASLGAALMYLFDPYMGARRRAQAKDQVVHLAHQTGNAVGPTMRDISNRARGLVAEATATFKDRDVSDAVLVRRARSKMGRYVSHPRSVTIEANQGRLFLSGPILAHEVDNLIHALSNIPGVTGVENRLEVYQEPGDVSGLQGGKARPGERPELAQEVWSPTTRLGTGAAGAGLALYGARNLGILGKFLSGIGLGMLVRAVTNLETKRLVGVDAGRR